MQLLDKIHTVFTAALIPPLSRLSYQVRYTLSQLSSCPRYPFVPCLCTVLNNLCVGRS